MEIREHTRYTPRASIMVILTLPVGGLYPLIGPLVDISESGLCFTFLPLQSGMEIPTQGPCEVVLKYGFRAFSKPIASRIVYGSVTSTTTSFMAPAMRCGIEFLTPLTTPEIETIYSCSPDYSRARQ
ncbi:MAG: hypothetical protein P4L43_05835 [Syntrophobacteraceae bacterium]|nr:hypothetical protein [Syntrophobacteraceae bacterium]